MDCKFEPIGQFDKIRKHFSKLLKRRKLLSVLLSNDKLSGNEFDFKIRNREMAPLEKLNFKLIMNEILF